MKILFVTRYYSPHVGGVERHAAAVAAKLTNRGHEITILTEKFDAGLKSRDKIGGVDVKRFWYPHIKFLGLIYIWFWLTFHANMVLENEVIHIHDIFVWYLPLRFLFFWKPVYITFHGWEGKWPIPARNIFLKRLAAKLSWGNICVGSYIAKYYGIKADKIIYGAED